MCCIGSGARIFNGITASHILFGYAQHSEVVPIMNNPLTPVEVLDSNVMQLKEYIATSKARSVEPVMAIQFLAALELARAYAELRECRLQVAPYQSQIDMLTRIANERLDNLDKALRS